jgi:hypothetical protein
MPDPMGSLSLLEVKATGSLFLTDWRWRDMLRCPLAARSAVVPPGHMYRSRCLRPVGSAHAEGCRTLVMGRPVFKAELEGAFGSRSNSDAHVLP